jgi:hypothetical protein
LVEAQLGARYHFQRLGTHLTREDLAAEQPALPWRPGPEDPHYIEPVVLAGKLVD